MFRHLFLAALVVFSCNSATAGVLTWGTASLADSGGNFLMGSSITTSGLSFTLLLPNFSQSDFAFPSGEVSVGVTATYDMPWINGVIYRYDGTIDQTFGPATVSYLQMASGAPGSPASGSFTGSPFSGTLLTGSSNNSIDLSAIIDLADNGGLAAINSIEFDIIAPEPGSAGVMFLGVALLGLFGRSRRMTT